MRKLLTAILFFFSAGVFAQKPALDTAAIAAWPEIYFPSISNDGKYISYTIGAGNSSVRILQSTDHTFKHNFIGLQNDQFNADSKLLICQLPGDTLCLVDLATKQLRYISNVNSYQIPQEGNGKWMAYLLKNGKLVLKNLFSEEDKTFANVQDYSFSKSGKVLLLHEAAPKQSGGNSLKWVNPSTGEEATVCSGKEVSNLTFDNQETQLAFLTSDIGGQPKTFSIRLYKPGIDSAELLVGNNSAKIEAGLTVNDDELAFSPDGEKLFFSLNRVPQVTKHTTIGASVDIWNYKDEYLQWQQLADPTVDHLEHFVAVCNIAQGTVLRLQQETDGFFGIGGLNHGGDDNYLLTESKCNTDEGYLRVEERPNLYLINTDNGSRSEICKYLLGGSTYFSPSGKFVFWFDPVKKAYFTYDLQNKITKNITLKIPNSIVDELNDYPVPAPAYGIAAWEADDRAVLIYDRYDIWKVDPTGKICPLNITNCYGRKNKIVLRYVYQSGGDFRDERPIVNAHNILLCALSDKNKKNGFFKTDLTKRADPLELTMAPDLFYFSGGSSHVILPRFMLKAKFEEKYLLRKMSVTEYPNLVLTSDFKTFDPVTKIEPQHQYNWFTSELVRWRTFYGKPGEGILYKPENFHPKKKYPVIINYYERMSDGLNNYIYPQPFSGILNIAWFVSRGYLVFCPDIHYKPGDIGASIYDYVVSAAKMLREESWIDGERIGIQGHSFGGFETNYLVTKTNLFAAAASSAGASDLVSMSGDAGFTAGSGQMFAEIGQFRMKVPLWTNLSAYIKNSPVFQANKVTTPFLILQNKEDSGTPWGQGVELFTALRRLNKPVWMLQYDHEGHNLGSKSSQLDYTIRLTQFFDHYLKGAPEPKWMSLGIPARLKGIDDGLEY